jgi:four helix bundle protein
MFLQLAHKQLDVYSVSKAFVHACYQLTKILPPEERFNMTQQIRRAALSV